MAELTLLKVYSYIMFILHKIEWTGFVHYLILEGY